MYKEVLANIDNIGTWPLISFVVFFTFFIGLLWWVFSVDKKYIERMSNMPLGDEKKMPVDSYHPSDVNLN